MNLALKRVGWSAAVLVGLAGCTANETPTPPAPEVAKPANPDGEKGKEATPTDPTKLADPGKPENTPGAAAEPVKLSEKEIAEIKKLPSEDQAIALAQMTCPVSGEKLGSMETPIKQVVEGKTFFLCCSGCTNEVKENPKGVLAKLEKK